MTGSTFVMAGLASVYAVFLTVLIFNLARPGLTFVMTLGISLHFLTRRAKRKLHEVTNSANPHGYGLKVEPLGFYKCLSRLSASIYAGYRQLLGKAKHFGSTFGTTIEPMLSPFRGDKPSKSGSCQTSHDNLRSTYLARPSLMRINTGGSVGLLNEIVVTTTTTYPLKGIVGGPMGGLHNPSGRISGFSISPRPQ